MMNKKLKRGTYYQCLKCGGRIYSDTNKKMISCQCGSISIDGCEHYTRVIYPTGKKYCYKTFYINKNGEIKNPKQYIIFDLEATCWEEKNDKVKEVIEVGAVKLNNDLETVDSFSEFVKPTINPELTDFCKNLTSIKQEDVDNARTFNDVVSEFERWIFTSDDNATLVSWGYYDKKQIMEEAKLKNYSGDIVKLLEEKHISLKHKFAQLRKEKPCGMQKALNKLNLPLEGTHHRAKDDAENIAQIFRAIYKDLTGRV